MLQELSFLLAGFETFLYEKWLSHSDRKFSQHIIHPWIFAVLCTLEGEMFDIISLEAATRFLQVLFNRLFSLSQQYWAEWPIFHNYNISSFPLFSSLLTPSLARPTFLVDLFRALRALLLILCSFSTLLIALIVTSLSLHIPRSKAIFVSSLNVFHTTLGHLTIYCSLNNPQCQTTFQSFAVAVKSSFCRTNSTFRCTWLRDLYFTDTLSHRFALKHDIYFVWPAIVISWF